MTNARKNHVSSAEKKGVLIAVEGLDGSGKSTQIYLLRRWLELDGFKVYFTEWNSSVIVKTATKKGKKRHLLTPQTFSLIHATDFADRCERQIMPLLRAGYIVLSDRYFFTALARDAVRNCDRQWVRNMYSFAPHPDITFYFDVPLEVSLGRILAGRPQLKYFEAGMDLGLADDPSDSFRIFQGRIREEYLKIVDEFGLVKINGSQTIEAQQAEVRRIIQERIDLAQYKFKAGRYRI
jgi:dTMP kinase